LSEDVRATVVDLRQRHRAVTGEDYELLAVEASPRVMRARSVPRRNLDALAEAARTAPRPGYVSVIVVPARPAPAPASPTPALPPIPDPQLLKDIQAYLEPRRLLTVRNVVVGPIYVPVQPTIVLAARPDVPAGDVRREVKAAVDGFLDPLTGGGDGSGGAGWPFGRDVYVSEVYQLLEGVPGVDYVVDVRLASVWPEPGSKETFPDGLRAVPATPLWHESGDAIGLALEAHHLPWPRIDPRQLERQIVVGTAFVPVRVRVEVVFQPDYALAPAAARQRVQAAVLPLFHPLLGGPDGSGPRDIRDTDIAAAVAASPDGPHIVRTGVTFSPSDRLFHGPGTVVGVHVAAGELVDWSLTVAVS
jgi:hypothetical protein